MFHVYGFGRSERIRTSGPCLPKAVLYQAELHSVVAFILAKTIKKADMQFLRTVRKPDIWERANLVRWSVEDMGDNVMGSRGLGFHLSNG